VGEASIGGDETCCSLVVLLPPLEHPASRNWPAIRVMASTRDKDDLVLVIVLTPRELG
jgi:hypothetical protein